MSVSCRVNQFFFAITYVFLCGTHGIYILYIHVSFIVVVRIVSPFIEMPSTGKLNHINLFSNFNLPCIQLPEKKCPCNPWEK